MVFDYSRDGVKQQAERSWCLLSS